MIEFEFLNISKTNPVHLNIDLVKTDYLCHYTDSKGIKGILSNNCFWVTRSDYLYDSSEIVQIKNVIQSVHDTILENHEKYANGMDTDATLLRRYMHYIELLGKKFANNQTVRDYDIYILSLSENSNSSHLFTNYSKTDGCCLVFDADSLLGFKAPAFNFGEYNGITVTGGKVIYSFEKQKEILMNDILEVYNSVIYRLRDLEIQYVSKTLYDKIFKELMYFTLLKVHIYAIFFKEQQWDNENEFRVTFLVEKVHNHMIKHRIRDSSRMPYIEFKFDRLPLKYIKRNPQNYTNAEELIKNTEYEDIEILD